MGKPRADGSPGGNENTTALNKRKLLKAFKSCKGLVYRACAKADIDHTTYYKYRKSDQEFADAIDTIIENIVDEAEDGLMKLMKDKDPHVKLKAHNIFLSAKGRGRGYGTQKQELSGHDGGPAVVYVNTPSNSRIPPRD